MNTSRNWRIASNGTQNERTTFRQRLKYKENSSAKSNIKMENIK